MRAWPSSSRWEPPSSVRKHWRAGAGSPIGERRDREPAGGAAARLQRAGGECAPRDCRPGPAARDIGHRVTVLQPGDPGLDEEFRAALGQIIADTLVPALRRYRAFLADRYLPAARESIAISANPDGVNCYRAAIRRFTTLDLTGEDTSPDRPAGAGRRRIKRGRPGATRLWKPRLPGRNAPAPGGLGPHVQVPDQVIPLIDSVLARAWAAAPKWFGIVPQSKLAVEPYPAFQEPSVPMGQYLRAALDGSRPGIYRVNLYLATKPGARLEIDRLTFHEGVPGHHFQLAIAQERRNVHPVTRFLSTRRSPKGGASTSSAWPTRWGSTRLTPSG